MPTTRAERRNSFVSKATVAEASKAAPRLVSVADATVMLGLGPSTVWSMISEGRLPSVKLGGRRLVPVSAIDRIVEGAGA